MRNDGAMACGQHKCDFSITELPGSNKSLASPCGRFCRSSQLGGFHPADDAVGMSPAPNRLLTLKHGGEGGPSQNGSKIVFYTDKTHILLQPHSQKSLNHFS